MQVHDFLDIHMVISFSLLFVAWRLGDLRRWREYYPTILYMICGDLLYSFMLNNYPLWKNESTVLPPIFCAVMFAVVSYPPTVTMYLSHFPERLPLRLAYILFWSCLFISIEFVTHALGCISYHHGWNIWWSLLFNAVMFPLLWLHHRRPLLADAGLLACAFGGLLLFGVPLEALG